MTWFACLVFAISIDVPVCAQQLSIPELDRRSPQANQPDVAFKRRENSVDVLIGRDLFTTFDYGSYAKPIFYPILGPGQIGMTRNWPMKDGVDGEAHDHPHHKSMWISHEIDGVSFWGESGGSVKTKAIAQDEKMLSNDSFRATSLWTRKDGKAMLTDSTLYQFGGDQSSRWIDCTITFKASHGDFRFDDTKEGLFAIRTHPDLRLTAKPKQGVHEVFGSAVNSNGDSGKGIWGKSAKWLLYQGPIDGVPMSVAMYDDPTNLRHPTTWHARDYGLVTANPFGLHHFQGKEKGAGEVLVKNGESLTLRYRVEFIKGLESTKGIEKRYQEFCGPTGSSGKRP